MKLEEGLVRRAALEFNERSTGGRYGQKRWGRLAPRAAGSVVWALVPGRTEIMVAGSAWGQQGGQACIDCHRR